MGERPLVSIMLPAQDAATTLRTAATSCLEQTFPDLELILVENDSTPQTIAVMESICLQDPRARILRCPSGGGFIKALNLAWKSARGDYLARMDADDYSYPRRIQKQVQFLRSNATLAAVGSLVRIRLRKDDGSIGAPQQGYAKYQDWLNQLTSSASIAAQRFVDSPIANPCAMIRRSVFDTIGGYRDKVWAEDYDFWLRMLDAGFSLGKVEDVLLDWHDSENRMTRQDARYSQEHFLAAKAHFLAQLKLVRERGMVLCGAGPIGKRLLGLLQKENVDVHAVLEVSERRIGNRIAGVPILGSEALPFQGHPVVIGAVGRPGARTRIRSLVQPFGYVEGHDFFLAA